MHLRVRERQLFLFLRLGVQGQPHEKSTSALRKDANRPHNHYTLVLRRRGGLTP